MRSTSVTVLALGTTALFVCSACGDESSADSEPVVTIAGCAFTTQLLDIADNGVRLDTPKRLMSQDNAVGVQISNSMGTWLLGTDADDVSVIVDRNTGEVRSHGGVHLGYEKSALPSVLALPVSLEE